MQKGTIVKKGKGNKSWKVVGTGVLMTGDRYVDIKLLDSKAKRINRLVNDEIETLTVLGSN